MKKKRRGGKCPMVATSPNATAAERRSRFIEAYVENGGNGTQAAIAVGCPEKTAKQAGSRMLRHPEVATAVESRRAAVLAEARAKTGLTVQRTLDEIARLAYFDIRKLFNPDGSMKKISELDDDTAAAVSQIEIDEIGLEGTVIGQTRKIKIADKNAALEKAMKHFGQYELDNSQKPAPTVNVGVLSVGLEFDKVRARAKVLSRS